MSFEKTTDVNNDISKCRLDIHVSMLLDCGKEWNGSGVTEHELVKKTQNVIGETKHFRVEKKTNLNGIVRRNMSVNLVSARVLKNVNENAGSAVLKWNTTLV